jgi:hypothetical protein
VQLITKQEIIALEEKDLSACIIAFRYSFERLTPVFLVDLCLNGLTCLSHYAWIRWYNYILHQRSGRCLTISIGY